MKLAIEYGYTSGGILNKGRACKVIGSGEGTAHFYHSTNGLGTGCRNGNGIRIDNQAIFFPRRRSCLNVSAGISQSTAAIGYALVGITGLITGSSLIHLGFPGIQQYQQCSIV